MDIILLIATAITMGVVVGDILYYVGKYIWSKTRYFIYKHSKTVSPSDIWKPKVSSKVERIIQNSAFGLGVATQDNTKLARYLAEGFYTELLPSYESLFKNKYELDLFISHHLAKAVASEYCAIRRCEKRIQNKIDIFEKEPIL